jgi:hypothetical protein
MADCTSVAPHLGSKLSKPTTPDFQPRQTNSGNSQLPTSWRLAVKASWGLAVKASWGLAVKVLAVVLPLIGRESPRLSALSKASEDAI